MRVGDLTFPIPPGGTIPEREAGRVQAAGARETAACQHTAIDDRQCVDTIKELLSHGVPRGAIASRDRVRSLGPGRVEL